MERNEFRVTRQKAAPTGPGAGPWRTVASFAGFFGALPFGFVPFFLAIERKGPRTPASEILLVVLLGVLSLVPFAVALSRAGRDAWFRTMTLAIPATIVGAVALFVYPFGLLVFPGAFGLGLLLGLAALVPCWRRGDAEGRALALLGIAPALLLLELSAANGAWHLGDRDVDAAAPFGPSASLPPPGSGISPAASPPTRDLSWLWGWESLLALVAVGLAIGALRCLWLRRRLRRLDAAGAATPREAGSLDRSIPPVDVAPVVAGPLPKGETGGRAERFRRHALALGAIWIVFGSILLLIGAGNLWTYISPNASVVWELRQVLLLTALAAYGLALAASGAGTCLRSRRAIGAGLALTLVALAPGLAVDGPLFTVPFFALSLALIYLAMRTIGLAGLPRHGEASRRGILAALGRIPARLAKAPTSRLVVAVVGCSLGATVGGIAGGVAGGLLMGVAAAVHLVSNQWGLAPVAGMAIGGMAGGAGGWLGGLVEGAALGGSGPRLRSVRLYGGMVGGLVVVLVVSVRDVHIDWTQRGRWHELLEFLLLAATTSAFGAATAGAAVGRLARAFADRGESRAGTHPLDD